MRTDPVIGCQIELFQFLRIIPAASLRLLRVHRRIPLLKIHEIPHFLRDRLIQNLNSEQSLPLAIPLRQPLQNRIDKFDLLRLLEELADAADAAVVKAIL